MSKARIPSPFGTETHKTEWTCAAKAAERMNEIVEEKRLEFGKAEVETTGEGDRKRADVALLESPTSNRPLCIIEFKAPYFDPFNVDELKEPARQKAVQRKAKYFCTSNFKWLIWFSTEKVNKGLSEEQQILEKYHLSEIEDLDLIEENRFKKSIQDGLERFLLHLYEVHRYKKPEPQHPIDEFLIFRLHEKIKTLTRLYTPIIRDNAHKDDKFRFDLQKWFVEQKWTPFFTDADFAKSARQAAYLLINKILFYDLFQTKRPHQFERLEIPESLFKGKSLQLELQRFFNQVLEVDYQTIYSTDFIDQTAFPDNKEVIREIKELITLLRRYDFSKIGYDIIGRIFERLIPAEERHNLGQYFTNPDVVDLILKFCLKHENDKVFDPACGAGTFLVRAYKHKQLMNQRLQHQQLLKSLWGCDIAKFPAHLATINLAVNDLTVDENYPQILHEDFFNLRLGGREEFGKEARKKTLVTVGAKKVVIDYPKIVDCIVGNPPYTRQEEISEISQVETYKEALIRKALHDGNKKVADISKRAGIYAYFFVHGTKFLHNGGRFGFVVSNSWLDVDYGKGLQEHFLKYYKIVAIIESKVERWFEDADINTCIVILERCTDKQQRDENLVRFAYLQKPLRHFIPPAQDLWEKQLSRLNEIDKLTKTILAHNEFYQNDELRIYPKKQSELWDEGLELVEKETSPPIPLSKIGEGDTGGEVQYPPVPGYIYELCRKLRKEQTTAEKLLWDCLRARRLNGLKFRRQHPLGRYIADFYCAERRLVVELEGKVHDIKDQQEYDKIRRETIEAMGLTVLRFKNEEVLENIERVLAHITSPPYSPSPQVERGTGGEVEKRPGLRYVGSKWGKYLRAPEIFFTILEKAKDKLVPLKEIAKVRRGFTTGANEFFYLTEEEIKQRGIEKEFWMHKEDGKWVPNYIIKSPRECKSVMLKPEVLENRVLMIHKDKKELRATNILKYIQEGERKGFHTRPTCAARGDRWYDLGFQQPPDLVWFKAFNDRVLSPINLNRISSSDRFYAIYLKDKKDSLKIAAVLNSTLSHLFVELWGRVNLGEGALDNMTYETASMFTIHPTFITKKAIKALTDSFAKRKIESIFGELSAQSPAEVSLEKIKPDRRELDKIVMGEILGLTEEEQLEVYRAVIDLVRSRLEKAKSFGKKKKTKEGVDIDALVKIVLEKVGGETLGKYYRERVLTSPPFSPSPNLEGGMGGAVRIGQELFDWYLYIGRKHIKCASELEARYLKVWAEAGVEKVKVPKNEKDLKRLVPELEKVKAKINETVNSYLNSIIDTKTRKKIAHLVWVELVR